MKKGFIYLALAAMMPLAACSPKGDTQKKEAEAAADEAFYAAQPVGSGEYRAVSLQDGDLRSDRNRFDGRVIMALSPDNSGIYIYENGNRTNFKATITLSKPFEKKDSVFVAVDKKNNPVMVIPGTENDTLMFVRRDTVTTKVAFERQAITELTAGNAWSRISEKIKE